MHIVAILAMDSSSRTKHLQLQVGVCRALVRSVSTRVSSEALAWHSHKGMTSEAALQEAVAVACHGSAPPAVRTIAQIICCVRAAVIAAVIVSPSVDVG